MDRFALESSRWTTREHAINALGGGWAGGTRRPGAPAPEIQVEMIGRRGEDVDDGQLQAGNSVHRERVKSDAGRKNWSGSSRANQ